MRYSVRAPYYDPDKDGYVSAGNYDDYNEAMRIYDRHRGYILDTKLQRIYIGAAYVDGDWFVIPENVFDLDIYIHHIKITGIATKWEQEQQS